MMALSALLPEVISNNLSYLLLGRWPEGEPGGLLLSILLALGAGGLALIGGFLLAILAYLGPGWLRRGLIFASDLIRGIPLLLVIFWLYFLLPALLGKGAPDSLSVIVALALFSATSVMHSVLAGIDSLPAGQHEAAFASGFNAWEILLWVLLPQALRHTLPSLVNLLVSLIKDTSLAFIVGVPELTMVAGQVNNRELVYPLEIYLFVGVLYFLLCSSLAFLASRLEIILNRQQGTVLRA